MKPHDLKKRSIAAGAKPGQFEGKFLVAMPNIGSDIFDRSVIYLCAHSEEGAMGFCINKASEMTIGALIESADGSQSNEKPVAIGEQANWLVRQGGPVDAHRGFVLHSAAYGSDASTQIEGDLYLTSSVQVLKSITNTVIEESNFQKGGKAVVFLGYAGWEAGQLETEMIDNAWLTISADPEFIFSDDHGSKYESMLALLGIDIAHFVAEGGRA